jgi:hypothetical protein
MLMIDTPVLDEHAAIEATRLTVKGVGIGPNEATW